MKKYFGLGAVAILFCMQAMAQNSCMTGVWKAIDSIEALHNIPYCQACSEFLNDPFGHPDLKFKSVTQLVYTAKDSSLKKKELSVKDVYTFNKLGEQTLTETYYIKNGSKDSDVFWYDDKKNLIRETEYTNDSAKRPMYIENDHFYAYDAKSNKIKDSSIDLSSKWQIEEVGKPFDKGLNKEYTYAKYDTGHNETWEMKVDEGDTTIQTYSYDSKGRVAKETNYNYGQFSSTIHTYDNIGNEIETMDVSGEEERDTVITKFVFDEQRRQIDMKKYDNGKLSSSESEVYNADSTYVKTEEEFGDETDGTCPDNAKTVTTYDALGMQVSKIITSMKEGTPFTTKVIDKLQYINRRLVSDTQTTAEEGNMYWSKSMMITTYKYDAAYNQIFSEEKGGGQYNKNSKQVAVYNSHRHCTRSEEYNSCSDKPETVYITEYYPNEDDVKMTVEISSSSKKINTFGKDSRKLESTRKNFNGESEMTVWEYEE